MCTTKRRRNMPSEKGLHLKKSENIFHGFVYVFRLTKENVLFSLLPMFSIVPNIKICGIHFQENILH